MLKCSCCIKTRWYTTVIGHHIDSEKKEKERSDPNPILNLAICNVIFLDGAIKQYAANTIAENIWAQVDVEDNQYLTSGAITDHQKKGNAVSKEDKYLTTKRESCKLH